MRKKSLFKRLVCLALTSCMLVSFTACGSKTEDKEPEIKKENVSKKEETPLGSGNVVTATYPETVKYPSYDDFYTEKDGYDFDAYNEAYDAWANSRTIFEDTAYIGKMKEFLAKSTKLMLKDSDGANRVYSPISFYLALGMLSEITDTDTRKEILSAMGVESIEEAREVANALWKANYKDDGSITSILGSSVWLSNTFPYKKDALDNLAKYYYSSSFSGEMGSLEYNSIFKDWLNAQTGDLLTDMVDSLGFTPETVLALATTVYYTATWQDEFYETEELTFKKADGTSFNTDFLKERGKNTVWFGKNFTATSKSFLNGGRMYFILPNSGVSTNDLLDDEEAASFMADPSNTDLKSGRYWVNMFVPKFDVSCQTDLKAVMQELGIEKVMGSLADFSPVSDYGEIVLSSASHGARVLIDEKGCKAAAFTVMMMENTAFVQYDEYDFYANRPFFFVITGNDGSILFNGLVNCPVE
ncbi:MAG: hypothetical protein K6B75_01490 [Lachnospiraceae bacterium]|nr:hypothetical protein [Lachnospiraceae bacterium]